MKHRPSFPSRLNVLADGSHVAAGQRPGAIKTTGQNVRTKSIAGSAARPSGQTAAQVLQRTPDPISTRRNMVRKLADRGLSDPRVMAAIGIVERHRFVDSALQAQAYEDTSLPIGLGQTISKPGVVARMVELLRDGCEGKLGRVLEIGTGCGYQAAVLSLVATEVYSIERLRWLHDKARDNLRYLRLANLHLLFGDGMAGFAKGAPYAGIIAAAGGDEIPQAWTDQLAVGGRLVAPVLVAGGKPAQQALLVIDKTALGLRRAVFEAVHFVPLKSGVA